MIGLDEFGVDTAREAARGQANVIAEDEGKLSMQNVVACGLAAVAFGLIYIGDAIRERE